MRRVSKFYGRLSSRDPDPADRGAVAAELHEHLESLDPFLPASIPVSWAGETESVAWFDVARELTERWHHQQQIRLAVDRPGIMTPELYGPVLECFMRGLPHAYRDVPARTGSIVEVVVTGECGGTWWLERAARGWALVAAPARERIDARTSIPQEIAWRVFTKGIARDEARSQVVDFWRRSARKRRAGHDCNCCLRRRSERGSRRWFFTIGSSRRFSRWFCTMVPRH